MEPRRERADDGRAQHDAAKELPEHLGLAQPPRELAEGARGQQDEREGDEREQNLPLCEAVHQGWWLLGAGAGRTWQTAC
ncbi:hypothetical protein WME93_21910 [Sorangium sp. So ce1000]